MKNLILLAFLSIAVLAIGCNNAPQPTAEEQAQQVQKANEAALNDPNSGAVSPDAGTDQGP